MPVCGSRGLKTHPGSRSCEPVPSGVFNWPQRCFLQSSMILGMSLKNAASRRCSCPGTPKAASHAGNRWASALLKRHRREWEAGDWTTITGWGGGEKKKKKALENTLYLPFQSTNSHLRLPFGMGIVLFAVSSESVRRISFISPPLPILEPFPAPSTRKALALLISLRRWWRPRWKSHRSSADCSF